MNETESYRKLRKGLRALHTDLIDLMDVLTTDDLSPGESRRTAQSAADREPDFFDHLTEDEDPFEDIALYQRVLKIITDLGYASTLVLQTKLEINYHKALSIVAGLERDGLIAPAHGFRPHKVLPHAHEVLARIEQDMTSATVVVKR
jgi:DNA segregation ATPase FtsK/SpoIIIE-like protein